MIGTGPPAPDAEAHPRSATSGRLRISMGAPRLTASRASGPLPIVPHKHFGPAHELTQVDPALPDDTLHRVTPGAFAPHRPVPLPTPRVPVDRRGRDRRGQRGGLLWAVTLGWLLAVATSLLALLLALSVADRWSVPATCSIGNDRATP